MREMDNGVHLQATDKYYDNNQGEISSAMIYIYEYYFHENDLL